MSLITHDHGKFPFDPKAKSTPSNPSLISTFVRDQGFRLDASWITAKADLPTPFRSICIEICTRPSRWSFAANIRHDIADTSTPLRLVRLANSTTCPLSDMTLFDILIETPSPSQALRYSSATSLLKITISSPSTS